MPAPESKSAQPNIQDVFLAAIKTPKAVSNYFSHQ